MQEINEHIFSKEELERVSNIIENNLSVLLKNTDYCKQENCITDLHEIICSKTNNTELQNAFEKYNNYMIDHKTYEFALIYNIGLLTGMELSNLKKEIKTYSEEYCSKKIIDFSKYLNQTLIQNLENLKIFIEDKLYTEEEYQLIKREILVHSSINNISETEKKEFLKIFSKIDNDYNFKN